ncbi:MAG: 4-hydroxy-tetrahydrodipicolinate reductase [Planctomycetales bacterium]|nr:4-hydroxy-tetrahydrodipicolinate reductase [Planctomycetales bacterium]MCA9169764.1 4-hydroxy-tetrahydrodipicolinate reductase [Planctomycetales bacterium]
MGSNRIRLGIHGAAGRMGRRLIALGSEDPALEVVAAIEQPGHVEIGKDAGVLAGMSAIGVPVASEMTGSPQVIIDFSEPAGAIQLVDRCLAQTLPLVLATTGLTTEQRERVQQAAKQIPIVWAPSMSLAVNLTMKLAALAGAHLKDYGPGADVEIIERHHRFKEDAPSGTALRFGELIAEQMGQTLHVHGREGRPGQRTRQEIGYHALRAGDNPGEHTIVFGMMGETIELTVKATNRDCYALGALAAAKFVVGKAPGVYGMSDVLGL